MYIYIYIYISKRWTHETQESFFNELNLFCPDLS